jgi:hypothetical protein
LPAGGHPDTDAVEFRTTKMEVKALEEPQKE